MRTYGQLVRSARIQRHADLRAAKRTPARPTYAYRVETTVIAIPDWAREQRIQALTESEDHIWLKSRVLATLVAWMDRDSGGKPTCDRMEIRRCQVCGRWLTGLLAKRRRELDESAMDGRKLPCDAECYERTQEA